MTAIVKIKEREVGAGHPAYIIAEIGINHNGDVEIARRLIDVAKEAGVDAVKFQKRTTSDILIRAALDKPYESENAFAPTYGAHREKLELSPDAYRDLFRYAEKKSIHFLASVWDHKSADYIDDLGCPAFKMASADLTNLPLLEYTAKKGKPMIVSTGMSTMEEIEKAVEVIQRHNNQLVLMHCVSTYPCEDTDVNLRVMDVLRKKFNVPVGYSGHDRGVVISAVAAALGANAIEKHITLDRTMKGSDHGASLEPDGLKRLVRYIRVAEGSLGDGVKHILDSEVPIRKKLAKSIAARINIPRGTVIAKEMLVMKGPGDGLKASFLSEVVGRVVALDIAADTLLPKEVLEWEKNNV